MNNKQLVYICDGIGSVFDSQVKGLLNEICETKAFSKIYLLLGYKNKADKLKVKKEYFNKNIELLYFKTFPNYAFYNLLSRISLKFALKKISELENVVYHIREEILAWHLIHVVSRSNHKKIIPDIRGANFEEVKQFLGFNIFREKFKVYNYKKAIQSIKKVSTITVVSESLKNYLIEKFGIEREKISVTSCLAGKEFKFDLEKRHAARKELNLNPNDKLLVFTSGGTADWQNNEALKYFMIDNVKLLNLSKRKIDYPNVINMFVKYDQIPNYLNAADIALIWREENIVNKVASPVKFSEYLCCGLPVITNSNIDLITDNIRTNNTGKILNSISEFNIEVVNSLLKYNRDEISSVGIKYFGINSIVQSYLSIYNNLS